MEASQSKAEQAPSSAISSSLAPSGYRGRMLAGALGLVVLVGLVWVYFWQAMPEPDRADGGFMRQVLFPTENPRIATPPVVRAGAEGGFIPRGLCSPPSTDPSAVTDESVAFCVAYPDGRLFLPRTDRGPRFLRQLIRDPSTGQVAALSLDGAVFRPVLGDGGVQWAETVPAQQHAGLPTAPTPRHGSTSCQADDCLWVRVPSGQSRSGQVGTESCGRRGNAGSEV